MSEYDITKLINTVNKQNQMIEVLTRKIDTLAIAVSQMIEQEEVSHGH